MAVEERPGRAAAKGLIALSLVAGLLFGVSGDAGWVEAWLFVAMFLGGQVAAFRVMGPDLRAERSRVQPGTKSWDKVILALIAVLLPLGTWTLAALDHRHRWSGGAHMVWTAAGFALLLAGIGIILWAIATNRFFSAGVRIQRERGHTVVSDGPYAYVRHPGYAGMLAFVVGTPLALGSRWALAPSALYAMVLIVRTVLEDRTLAAELDGYAEYRERVRSRLVPSLW
jgi:protein-S-isoprenylcysteine O-methyltransferase Ste14